MKVHTFLHRHYSSQVGESPLGHAIAIVAGAGLVFVGVNLMSVVFLPLALVVGLVGAFLFVEGLLAHIRRPLEARELADSVIGFTGAAIAITFALAVLLFLVTFGAGTFAAIIDWIRQVA